MKSYNGVMHSFPLKERRRRKRLYQFFEMFNRAGYRWRALAHPFSRLVD